MKVRIAFEQAKRGVRHEGGGLIPRQLGLEGSRQTPR